MVRDNYQDQFEATYCPEDNKLRLYVGRVSRPAYESLKAEGWTSTPKQLCDFVTTWQPDREQTALHYGGGVIGDEDQSPEDRAAERAERFTGYLDKRAAEALGHADTYDEGPAVHGFQSYARAVRAADRHDRQAERAITSWDKAEYWERRTAGVISHALYRSDPGVRMGRIKEIETDIRRYDEAHEAYTARYTAWEKIAAGYPGPALGLAVICRHDFNGKSLHDLITDGMSHGDAAALFLRTFAHPSDRRASRRLEHLRFRLAYENQMLEAAGGRAGILEIEVGGTWRCDIITKVNKSNKTGRVVSVRTVNGVREVERQDPSNYSPPTPETLAQLKAWKAAEKQKAKDWAALIINPSVEEAERLQAQLCRPKKYNAIVGEVKRMTASEYAGLVSWKREIKSFREPGATSPKCPVVARVNVTTHLYYMIDIVHITDLPTQPLPSSIWDSQPANL